MLEFSTQQLYQTALQHHRAGQLAQARQLYEQVLARVPHHAEALSGLGIIAHFSGEHDAAAAFLTQAIASSPATAGLHLNLGLIELARGRFQQAVAAQREAVRLVPQLVEAHFNLGNALQAAGQRADAIAAYRTALGLRPAYVEALFNLGQALHAAGQLPEAVEAYREAVRLRPAFAEAYNNLGAVLTSAGESDAAIQAYQTALRLKPAYADAHYNLAGACLESGQHDDAVAAYREAIRLRPDYAEAHNNLGCALKDIGLLDEALEAFQASARLGSRDGGSNLVYTMNFHPACDARAIYEEACRWSQRHAAPLAHLIQPHANDRAPERPLRVGYVSANFRTHPIGQAFLPLALRHDRRQVRVVCYSGVRRPDAYTQRLQTLADEWRDTVGLGPKPIADLVRQDKIDILVDLTMHMGRSNLLVFAQKPAPVQVASLCLLGTTGLSTIDHRISDPYCDPPGLNDAFYTEKTIRLPDVYMCREMPADSPPVGPAPAAEAGYVTFGSLNNFGKVTPEVLRVWGRILREVAGSKLLLRCPAGSAQARVRGLLGEAGVSEERVEFYAGVASWDDYLRAHHRMDIYLDTFPYCGVTTCTDALWMGVPLVTLAGQRDVGRGGVYLLSNLGVPELIAQIQEDYVQKAVALAGDLGRMAALRGSLRERMQASPLMDMEAYARHTEAAYRDMWRRWCAS